VVPLFVSVVGCVTQGTVPPAPTAPPAPTTAGNVMVPAKDVVKEQDQPKRRPQSSTCVAFGNLELEAANEGDRTPAQRQDLFERARKYFQQALKTEPKCLDAYHGLARAYQGLGDNERTLETYRRAIEAFPKNAALRYELGMYQARQKRWTGALENLKVATELDPENRTYTNMRGYCLARAGRYEESYACFKKSVGEAQAHYNVARMLQHVGQPESCKMHLELALKAKPDFAPARELLAEIGTAGKGKQGNVAVNFESRDDPGAPMRKTTASAAAPAKAGLQ
jgi:tetratricopeptide (TPR) repeat protein